MVCAACFKNGDWDGAIAGYSAAVDIDPSNHVYYSNRSAAYGKKYEFELAEADGIKCVQINASFVKGWYRLADAQFNLGKYADCVNSVRNGCKFDPKSFEGLKGEMAYHYFFQEAKKAMKAGEWDRADQLIKEGQGMDFHNEKLKELKNELEPKKKQSDLAKRSGMSPAELTKEQGNDLFKTSQFDSAIAKYTDALNLIDDKTSALAVSCYNNRSACHQQQSNFQAVIEDASAVIEVDEKNVKALMRRGLAFEGMEKYKLALQDIRAVLYINPQNDIANRGQHRISSALRQEEKMKRGN